MRLLLVVITLVVSAKWLDYRFSRDYGSYFFDYSLNGRYANDKNPTNSFKVISTDRGVYFPDKSSSIRINPVGSFPATFTLTTWVLCKDVMVVFFYYEDTTFRILYGRGSGENRIRLYLKSNIRYGNPKEFYFSNSHSDSWIMISLVHSNGYFKCYANKLLSETAPSTFVPQGSYQIGLGFYENPQDGLVCFMWNFVIYDQDVNFLGSIVEVNTTACLLGSGSCTNCSIALNDEDLGVGCLSTNQNFTMNSYNSVCLKIGCTKTINLQCGKPNSICSYNFKTNTCLVDDVINTIAQPSTITNCDCISGNLNSKGNCCGPICGVCDSSGVCIKCIADNAVYSNGLCDCMAGFYSAGNYSNTNNCIPCENSCTSCNSTDCFTCSQPNLTPSGKLCVCLNSSNCVICDINSKIVSDECICNNGYYGNGTTCTKCGDYCEICSNSTSCTKCLDSNTQITGPACQCLTGFYQDGLICSTCHSSCESCSSSSKCDQCFDPNTIIQGPKCECKAGFYLNNTICLACHTSCYSCSSSTSCEICKYPNTILLNGNCTCSPGFYLDSSSRCQICNSGCLNCTSYENCFKCSDINAIIIGNECKCPAGFYQENYNCLSCGEKCSKCLNQDKCQECERPDLVVNGGKCNCNYGFYEDSTLKSCVECKSGCLNCNQTQCFSCIDRNSLPYSNTCMCKKGFWLDGGIGMIDSCKPCNKDCETCENSFNCLTCKAINAGSGDFQGCKCNNGYWNESSLSYKDSCRPCKDDCEVCYNNKTCLKCKYGQGILNSIGSCVKLCWKLEYSERRNCTLCPNLCTECDKNLKCTKCVSNSFVEDEICICKPGYVSFGSECIEKYFYGELRVSESNKMFLNFSKSVKTNITEEDFKMIVNGQKVKLDLFKESDKKFIFILKDKIDLSSSQSFILSIDLPVIESYSNSVLESHNFTGNLYAITIDVKFYGIELKQGFNIILISSLATSIMSNPSTLWSILNTVQLIIYMPLNSVPHSDKLKKISASLLNYNLIPNVFKSFIDKNCTTIPYNQAYEFGIKSSVFILNLGSMIIIFFSLLILSILGIPIIKLVFKSRRFQSLSSVWGYKSLMRFWIQSYLEFGIFSFIQLKSQVTKDIESQTISGPLIGIASICIAGFTAVKFI